MLQTGGLFLLGVGIARYATAPCAEGRGGAGESGDWSRLPTGATDGADELQSHLLRRAAKGASPCAQCAAGLAAPHCLSLWNFTMTGPSRTRQGPPKPIPINSWPEDVILKG